MDIGASLPEIMVSQAKFPILTHEVALHSYFIVFLSNSNCQTILFVSGNAGG
jgi:hypothetical protein